MADTEDALSDAPVVLAFLDAFWALASTESEDRAVAAASLAAHAGATPAAIAAGAKATAKDSDDEGDEEEGESEGFGSDDDSGDEGKPAKGDGGASQQQQHTYAVKRLVRGLCSSRGGARQGFASGLSLVLGHTTEAQVGMGPLLAALEEETALAAGMRGQEERDLLLGRLFGLAAIARHARDAAAAAASASAGSACGRGTLDRVVASHVLVLLVELFGKRRWLREATVAAINDLVAAACASDPAFACDTLLPLLAPLLADVAAKNYSAEHLALALVVGRALGDCSEAGKGKAKGAQAAAALEAAALFPRHAWPVGMGGAGEADASDVESAEDAAAADGVVGAASPSLPRMLLPSAVDALEEPFKAATGTFPRLHLAFELALDALAATTASTSAGASAGASGAAGALWGGAVGEALRGGSHQMKGMALALLPELAARLAPAEVSGVCLGPSTLRLLLNSTAKQGNVLCLHARACLDKLAGKRQTDSAWRLTVAIALMARDDQATR